MGAAIQVVDNVDKGERGCVRFQEFRIFARFRGVMSCIHTADVTDKESISALRDGLNIAGIIGVIVQRIPQLTHRHPQAAVKINKRIAGPEAASKFFTTDYFSGIFQERDEEPMG
jgi:hypothetical protein